MKTINLQNYSDHEQEILADFANDSLRYSTDDPDWNVDDLMEDTENIYRPNAWEEVTYDNSDSTGHNTVAEGGEPTGYEVLVSKKELGEIYKSELINTSDK
jgi:hypothetical protein